LDFSLFCILKNCSLGTLPATRCFVHVCPDRPVRSYHSESSDVILFPGFSSATPQLPNNVIQLIWDAGLSQPIIIQRSAEGVKKRVLICRLHKEFHPFCYICNNLWQFKRVDQPLAPLSHHHDHPHHHLEICAVSHHQKIPHQQLQSDRWMH